MEMPPPSQISHLFTVRLWAEPVGFTQVEWRGKLQHVLSGEVRYFRDWQTMIVQIEELLAAARGPGVEPESGSQP